jgi:hypothetical protein
MPPPISEQLNLLAAASLNSSEKKIFELLGVDEPKHIEDIVERSGLALFRGSSYAFRPGDERADSTAAGKQFSKVLL